MINKPIEEMKNEHPNKDFKNMGLAKYSAIK